MKITTKQVVLTLLKLNPDLEIQINGKPIQAIALENCEVIFNREELE